MNGELTGDVKGAAAGALTGELTGELTEPLWPACEGLIRPARRPIGWQAPGPRPVLPRNSHGQIPSELMPGADEDLCFLLGDWRILQQQRGHRWSVDDLVTAYQASEALCPEKVTRSLDLGCGIGSVLMMVAWKFPQVQALGIEAQTISAGMARRSLRWNGIEPRVQVREGDIRDRAMLPEGNVFELVTGTPPYFDLNDGVTSQKVQCTPCRFEVRGGVEAYCEAASRAMAPQGRFVVIEDADQEDRVLSALSAVGMIPEHIRVVIPKEGRPPLITVFTARWPREDESSGAFPSPLRTELVVRTRAGQWTNDFSALREAMGMPGRVK